MHFNLVGLLAFWACFDKIEAFATQRPNRGVEVVCQSYSVEKAMFPRGVLEARAPVDCESCASSEKCCKPKDAAPFCIPEDASCCGRTWCSPGFQCYKSGDYTEGCCPIGGTCAVGGSGCCKEGCHDFGSTACTMGEVDPSLCCSAAYPNCRWDSSLGYGCFDSEGTQSVTRSESTNASSTPSTPSTIETGSRTTATTTSGNVVGTSAPSTLEMTREETHTLPTASPTATLPGTLPNTADINVTASSGTKQSSATRISTTTAGPGTAVAATGTASPSDTSTAIGAGFADLSKARVRVLWFGFLPYG
ncbi:hypothetical protein C7212DRAFT_344856 [Tuber magnatum]|uniref:Uncharacterized protein n=1 Tax=Tuber magnatum TaxID=42249 RepID=A0A317SM86_9PEZI|nr:hypothetical protein C7212DRAFT_344856 [Tuber magnatum]